MTIFVIHSFCLYSFSKFVIFIVYWSYCIRVNHKTSFSSSGSAKSLHHKNVTKKDCLKIRIKKSKWFYSYSYSYYKKLLLLRCDFNPYTLRLFTQCYIFPEVEVHFWNISLNITGCQIHFSTANWVAVGHSIGKGNYLTTAFCPPCRRCTCNTLKT